MKKKRVNKRKRNKILALMGVIVITAGILCTLTFTVFFTPKNIIAQGSMLYSQEELIKASGITNKDNILFLNQEEILKRTQQTLPYIGTLEINKKLPNSVELIYNDVDTYLIFGEDGSNVQTDINLRILPEEINVAKHFVEIKCEWSLDSSGKYIKISNSEDYEFAKTVIKACKEANLYNVVIDLFDNDKLLLIVENKFEVDFGSRYNFEEKFAQLLTTIEETDENAQGQIDLSSWTKDSPNAYFRPGNIKK